MGELLGLGIAACTSIGTAGGSIEYSQLLPSCLGRVVVDTNVFIG